MHSQYKRFFLYLFFFLAFRSNSHAIASDWFEGGTLHLATLREWKLASQQNQLATCADLIAEVVVDNYFKLPFSSTTEDTTQLKNYAYQLLWAINTFAYGNNHANDNETVSGAALLSMLQFGWIDESYIQFLSKIAQHKINFVNKKMATSPNHTNEVFTPNPPNPPTPPKTTIPRTKVKAKPKRKLMNKNEGRAWVKKNLVLRADLPLDELVLRFGQYEKKSIENAELYYFKRIDMTFFLLKIHSSMEFVGWAYGNS